MKENSIEEDIKIALDKFLDNKDIESAIFIVKKFILGNYVLVGGRKNIVKDSLRYILSDYKRVLKENEDFKDTECLVKRYFKLKDTNTYLKKENEELKAKWDKDTHILQNELDYANADRIDLAQQNKELRKENKEKNKIIDLMTNKLALYCEINCEEDIKTNKEQIKQYFANKAKEVQ